MCACLYFLLAQQRESANTPKDKPNREKIYLRNKHERYLELRSERKHNMQEELGQFVTIVNLKFEIKAAETINSFSFSQSLF